MYVPYPTKSEGVKSKQVPGPVWPSIRSFSECDCTRRITQLIGEDVTLFSPSSHPLSGPAGLSLAPHLGNSPLLNPGSIAQSVKNLSAMQETWVLLLVWADPLEKGMATHSSRHGQRSLAGYGPWGRKSQTWLSDKTTTATTCICSCKGMTCSRDLPGSSMKSIQAREIVNDIVKSNHRLCCGKKGERKWW